ncbi:MAG: hypothetical protein QXK37_06390 [Candidatus Woesearchaeota archaeon]
MSLLGPKEDYSKMEEQIKILATNLEVLNQMLVKDPNLGGAVGEGVGGISPQQYQELMDNIKNLARKYDAENNNLRELLNQELDYIKTTLRKIQELNAEFPKQKQELDIVVKRLNNVIEMFSAADKQSMGALTKEMRDFNQNVASLNENMQFFQQKLLENINYRVNEVGENVANKLARTAMIGVGIFVVIGMIFLIATRIV